MGNSNTEEGSLCFVPAQTRPLQSVGTWLGPALQAAGATGCGEDAPGKASTSRQTSTSMLLIPLLRLPSLTYQVPPRGQTL